VAQLRKDDVQELWNETPRHDWSNFRQTLEKHRGKKDSIEDSVINTLLVATQDLEKSRQNFPESFDKFYDLLNQKVEASGRSTRNEGEGRTQGKDRDSSGRGSRGDGESRNQGEARNQTRGSGERGSRGDGESRSQSRGSGERSSRGDGEEQNRGGKR
jgi:hypothetical protein